VIFAKILMRLSGISRTDTNITCAENACDWFWYNVAYPNYFAALLRLIKNAWRTAKDTCEVRNVEDSNL
jgi:hypothetical protein